jgi:translation initiation factor 1
MVVASPEERTMARKDPRRIDTSSTKSELAHNPFAALASLASQLPKASEANVPAAAADESEKPAPAPESACATRPKGRLLLRRETKHRGGKTVVIVSGFEGATAAAGALRDDDVVALGAELKRALGCGGTVEDGPDGKIIVVQGDKPARVAELLAAKGFRVDGVTS